VKEIKGSGVDYIAQKITLLHLITNQIDGYMYSVDIDDKNNYHKKQKHTP
jgi:hypothetical protein